MITIRSDEIVESELIDIVSEDFWKSVKYIEPEMPIKLCISPRKEAAGNQKTGNKIKNFPQGKP